MDIYNFSFKDTVGNTVAMSQFKGKVLLLVNTATQCGLAGQFEELQKLHMEYKDKGLVVIGFPCDQFAGQEPETNDTVVGVCQVNFGVTFMLSEKIHVNGKDTHAIFHFLKSRTKSLLGGRIKWNFTKFLVSKDGKTVKRFAPTTTPEHMREDIEKLLNS